MKALLIIIISITCNKIIEKHLFINIHGQNCLFHHNCKEIEILSLEFWNFIILSVEMAGPYLGFWVTFIVTLYVPIIFATFWKKCLWPKWTIYKHVSDNSVISEFCLSSVVYCLCSVVCSVCRNSKVKYFVFYDHNYNDNIFLFSLICHMPSFKMDRKNWPYIYNL